MRSGAAVMVGVVLVSLACGGGGGGRRGDGGHKGGEAATGAPAAASNAGIIDLRFSKWDCSTANIEMMGDGTCYDSMNPDWSCAFVQDGNKVDMTWTPGPKTAAGNEQHHWRGEIMNEIEMGGSIEMSNWRGNWRCARTLY